MNDSGPDIDALYHAYLVARAGADATRSKASKLRLSLARADDADRRMEKRASEAFKAWCDASTWRDAHLYPIAEDLS